jgi:hypothetical protein
MAKTKGSMILFDMTNAKNALLLALKHRLNVRLDQHSTKASFRLQFRQGASGYLTLNSNEPRSKTPWPLPKTS